MQRTALVLFACLVLGLAGGLLGSMLASGPGPGGSPGAGAADRGATDGAAREDLARRVVLLEERLAALLEGPSAPAPVPSAPAPGGAAVPVGDIPASPGTRDASLVARVERIEKALGILPEDLAKLSTEELKAFVPKYAGGREYGATVALLEELLKRGLPEEEARKFRFQLGYGYRGLGQHAKEEALFRELARTLPPDSEDGLNAVFQIGWSRYFQRDLKDASRWMEQLASNPAADPVRRANGLLCAGRFAKDDGDAARARLLLERLVNEEAANLPESQKTILDQAKQMLGELEGK